MVQLFIYISAKTILKLYSSLHTLRQSIFLGRNTLQMAFIFVFFPSELQSRVFIASHYFLKYSFVFKCCIRHSEDLYYYWTMERVQTLKPERSRFKYWLSYSVLCDLRNPLNLSETPISLEILFLHL